MYVLLKGQFQKNIVKFNPEKSFGQLGKKNPYLVSIRWYYKYKVRIIP